MCYDLLVLVLSTAKLSRQPSKSPLKERLLAQGLLYFAIATMANILPMVRTTHAPFTIIYLSLSSTGFFFPWFQWYDHALFFVACMIQRMAGMVNVTGPFGKLVVRGGVCMI